jgi:hypothetical protein
MKEKRFIRQVQKDWENGRKCPKRLNKKDQINKKKKEQK